VTDNGGTLDSYLPELPAPPTAAPLASFSPLSGIQVPLDDFFSQYDRFPKHLTDTSEAPGILVCVRCDPPVFYRDKTVAQNKDDHWNDRAWLKRYHLLNDGFDDPIVQDWLSNEQQEAGLRPANNKG